MKDCHKKLLTIIKSFFILTTILVIFNILIVLLGLYKTNSIQKNIDNQNVYFKLQQMTSPFNVPLENYFELYSQLCNNSKFDYYECYLQYLEKLPESQYFYNYENESLQKNCEAALCIQISENLQNTNHLKCYAGKLFAEKDFQYVDATIPIILGYEYRNLFEIGSCFSAIYLYDTYTFEVIGILEKDSRIYNMTSNIYLDKYIIMPSFNVLQITPETETDGTRIHYANKTSGLLVTSKNHFTEISNYITQLLSNTECGNYSIDISPIEYIIIEKIGIDIRKLIFYLFLILLIFNIFYYKHIKKSEQIIINNRILFICTELVGSYLIFFILYRAFLYLVLVKTDIKVFIIWGIFIVISKKIYIPRQKKKSV